MSKKFNPLASGLRITITCALIIGATLSTLYFGNPQWHKYFYNFQTRYRGPVKMPENYTGSWKTWYDNGQPQRIAQYENGMETGESSSWSEFGKLQSTFEFKDEKLIGTFWNHAGQKTKCSEFETVPTDSGNILRMHGISESWYKGGEAKESAQFNHGKLNGENIVWLKNGSVATHGLWNNGQRWQGTFLIWDPLQAKYIIFAFTNGKVTKGTGNLLITQVDNEKAVIEQYQNGELLQTLAIPYNSQSADGEQLSFCENIFPE